MRGTAKIQYGLCGCAEHINSFRVITLEHIARHSGTVAVWEIMGEIGFTDRGGIPEVIPKGTVRTPYPPTPFTSGDASLSTSCAAASPSPDRRHERRPHRAKEKNEVQLQIAL